MSSLLKTSALFLLFLSTTAALVVPSTDDDRQDGAHDRRGVAPRDTANQVVRLDMFTPADSTTMLAALKIGTPPRPFWARVLFESDWITLPSVALCDDGDDCVHDYHYNKSASSSYTSFDMQPYNPFDQRPFERQWMTETVTVSGGVPVTDVYMSTVESGAEQGAVMETQLWPELGLGFAVASSDWTPSLMYRLVEQGIINTAAYSFWFDELDGEDGSSSGSILLGGTDKAKYNSWDMIMMSNLDLSGGMFELYLVELSYDYGFYYTSIVEEEEPVKVAITPTAPFTVLPRSAAYLIWNILGAEISQEERIPGSDDIYEPMVVQCDLADVDEEISFKLSTDAPSIVFPIKDLIGQPWPGPSRTDSDDSDWCLLNVQSIDDSSSQDPVYVIGSPFLRRAYTIFDLARQEIGIAQNLFSDDSSVEALGPNGDSSDFPPGCSDASCRNGGGGLRNDDLATSQPLGTAMAVLVYVAVAGLIVGIGVLIFCCCKKRKERKAREEEEKQAVGIAIAARAARDQAREEIAAPGAGKKETRKRRWWGRAKKEQARTEDQGEEGAGVAGSGEGESSRTAQMSGGLDHADGSRTEAAAAVAGPSGDAASSVAEDERSESRGRDADSRERAAVGDEAAAARSESPKRV